MEKERQAADAKALVKVQNYSLKLASAGSKAQHYLDKKNILAGSLFFWCIVWILICIFQNSMT